MKCYSIVNLAVALCLVALGSYAYLWSPSAGDREGTILLFFSASCCFVATLGFVHRNRWVVALASLPLILLAGALVLLVAVGGWIWGPGQASSMHAIILIGLLVLLFEISGVLVAFIASPKPVQQEKAG